MDKRLQELNRQWDANPGDLQIAAQLIAAFRRITGGTPPQKSNPKPRPNKRYNFRNYPVNITDEDSLWAIIGGEYSEDGTSQGGGVLEWCISFDDANQRAELILQDGRFRGIMISKYQGGNQNWKAWCDYCHQPITQSSYITRNQAGLFVCVECAEAHQIA